MKTAKKDILSLRVNYGRKADFLRQLALDVDQETGGYVCFANAHMALEAEDDPGFGRVVNTARYTLPDGYPIARSFGIFYGMEQERIPGMDFLPEFLAVCSERNFRVGFIGSTEGILQKLREHIKEYFPGVELTSLISPPFGKPWDNKAYIDDFNGTNTQVVFVALGCPKQEKWMYENYNEVNALMLGIGAALPTMVGEMSRAPDWMCKAGLEWLYRLIQEPGRLWKRYIIGNSKFIYLVIRNNLKG